MTPLPSSALIIATRAGLPHSRIPAGLVRDDDRRDKLRHRMTDDLALQDRYYVTGRCFGCGPANEQGLRIKSRVVGDAVVLEWTVKPHHEAWTGVVNGGIIGALFDCHCNWTAAWHLMNARGDIEPPSTVTAEFHVKLRRPTSSERPLSITARVAESNQSRAVIEATLKSGDETTATCRGVFVAVLEGHPAYHRWDA